MDNIDAWTRTLGRALDVIFIKYPARTGLGIVLGSMFYFLARLFDPALRTLTFADFSGAPWWGWLSLGILVMHAPTIASLGKQRPIGNDSIDQALELIERANFTQAEKRQHYRNLIERVTRSVALSQETQREVTRIERSITSEEPPSRD